MKDREIKQLSHEIACRLPIDFFKNIKKVSRLRKIIGEMQEENHVGILDSMGLSIRRRSRQ